ADSTALKNLALLNLADIYATGLGSGLSDDKTRFFIDTLSAPDAKAHLEKALGENFLDYRLRIFSTNREGLPESDSRRNKAKAELARIQQLYPEDYQCIRNYLGSVESPIQVIDYCFFFCTALRPEILIKLFFLLSRVARKAEEEIKQQKFNPLRWLKFSAPTALAPFSAEPLGEILSELSYEDIVRKTAGEVVFSRMLFELAQSGLRFELKNNVKEARSELSLDNAYLANWYRFTKLTSIVSAAWALSRVRNIFSAGHLRTIVFLSNLGRSSTYSRVSQNWAKIRLFDGLIGTSRNAMDLSSYGEEKWNRGLADIAKERNITDSDVIEFLNDDAFVKFLNKVSIRRGIWNIRWIAEDGNENAALRFFYGLFLLVMEQTKPQEDTEIINFVYDLDRESTQEREAITRIRVKLSKPVSPEQLKAIMSVDILKKASQLHRSGTTVCVALSLRATLDESLDIIEFCELTELPTATALAPANGAVMVDPVISLSRAKRVSIKKITYQGAEYPVLVFEFNVGDLALYGGGVLAETTITPGRKVLIIAIEKGRTELLPHEAGHFIAKILYNDLSEYKANVLAEELTIDSKLESHQKLDREYITEALKDNEVIAEVVAAADSLATVGITETFLKQEALAKEEAMKQKDIFEVPADARDSDLAARLIGLNELGKANRRDAVIAAVLADSVLKSKVCGLIRAQDRARSNQGYAVNWKWAEDLKQEALRRAAQILEGVDILILQMEYEFSKKFLDYFEKHLEFIWKCSHPDAVFNTGEVAKINMAGGLGSFKPDLVKGWSEVLQKFWGPIEAIDSLHVMGVLYAKAIKGKMRDEGCITPRGPVTHDRALYEKFQIDPEEGIMGIVKGCLQWERTYRINLNIDIREGQERDHVGTVEVDIYRNRFSELNEYWMYCPQVFNEAYPGDTSDDWRAVQTLLYRKVLLHFVVDNYRWGKIGNNILFSTSEVNTTIAIPAVIKDCYNPEVLASRKDRLTKSEEIALYLFRNIHVHHYNHTIVPAGLSVYHAYMFDRLQIADRFRTAVHDGIIDLVKITGAVSDIVTGCSSAHTRILAQERLLFRGVSHKVIEDRLFGNSEGSDIERWQGLAIRQLINKVRGDIVQYGLGVSSHAEFFARLEQMPFFKDTFIPDLLEIKRQQKRLFIKELFDGTFGELNPTLKQEGDAAKGRLEAMPFFTFVRRLVPYKCANMLVDIISGYSDLYASAEIINKLKENGDFRDRVVKSGAVLVIGGRRFDGFGDRLQERVWELLRNFPGLRYHLIFISNHNVHTSWMIQQGTDFGGMLSYKDKEAGPTSFGNAQQNGSPSFGTPDGVFTERVLPIARVQDGSIISGSGYLVEYEKEPCKDGESKGEIVPDMESLVSKLEEACADYKNMKNYSILAYNALRMGMTQGDNRNQAKGLICVWADLVAGKYSNVTAQVQPYPWSEMDHTKTRDGQPLGLFLEYLVLMPVTSIAKAFGAFKRADKIDNASVNEAIRRLNSASKKAISRRLEYAAKSGKVRAGPAWIFKLLKPLLLWTDIDAFNLSGWMIINPSIINNHSLLIAALIHEAGALFGLMHEDNLDLEGIALKIMPAKQLVGIDCRLNSEIQRIVMEDRIGKVVDHTSSGKSRFEQILFNPETLAELPLTNDLFNRYSGQTGWCIDRLDKSTAGLRGTTMKLTDTQWKKELAQKSAQERAAIVQECFAKVLNGQEESPQLHPFIVALFTQAYANYIRSNFPPEQQGMFVGHDERYFSREYADIITRVLIGNQIKVLRDSDGSTATPVSSYMGYINCVSGSIEVTASHNAPYQNGMKSATRYGGVDTDDISDKVAMEVKKLYNSGKGSGAIYFGVLSNQYRVEKIDAKQIYFDNYISKLFPAQAIEDLKEAMRQGAKFIFDGIWGVGGKTISYYFDRLLGDFDWRKSVIIINDTPDPAMGGIFKPDPSVVETLSHTGALGILADNPDVLISITSDMDADRTGTGVIIPESDVAKAKKFGLVVNPKSGVNIACFTPNQIFTLIAYERVI
ncbi:MAG: hypothetical protein KJ880_06810, partial [Candidatus Omnitrophica bacterium]|nr:hypothetical protein [Candidatus Omnitrophota bacterium]